MTGVMRAGFLVSVRARTVAFLIRCKRLRALLGTGLPGFHNKIRPIATQNYPKTSPMASSGKNRIQGELHQKISTLPPSKMLFVLVESLL